MKSTGNYFYVKKVELKSDFTQIPNALFYVDLSATEKLILAYLLSNAESFRITNYRIAKSVGSDHRTVKKTLKKFHDMKLIISVTNKTITINVGEIIKLSEVNRGKENENEKENENDNDNDNDNGNSPNSTITDNGSITNRNSTANTVGELPSNNSNSTTKISVEVPNNNTNQQEIKEEKQKEASSSSVDIQNEVSDYLKTPSKFFYGNNQIECSKVYKSYREAQLDTNMTSIKLFEMLFYYYMLKMTNTKDVQELNQRLSKGGLKLTLNDIFKTILRIFREKEVFNDCNKELYAVIGTSNKSQNSNK
jgi:hypothetical protein